MSRSEVIDERRALRHLMDLLAIEGPSGGERRVAEAVREKLLAAGCRPTWIRHDRAHRRIGRDFEVGNLIVLIPGTVRAPRRLFSGHMDTVPLCRGARPVRRGGRIVSRGETALGGDNRTAVACLVTLAEAILARDLPHPPLTLLFTVGEEIGLCGSREVSVRDLGDPEMGFNIDSGAPRDLIVGAVGADRIDIEVLGRSSHAGVHPEKGISATLIASRAIADLATGGWFGKIEKGRRAGTSNVGTIQGGEATNQVTDRVHLRAETRSRDPSFLPKITKAYRDAFEKAARSVEDDRGRHGSIRFEPRREYDAFRIDDDAPPVLLAARCARSLRLRPRCVEASGGLDANHLNAKGIPTVTLGGGQHGAHTVDEYVDVREYVLGCRLALRIATSE